MPSDSFVDILGLSVSQLYAGVDIKARHYLAAANIFKTVSLSWHPKSHTCDLTAITTSAPYLSWFVGLFVSVVFIIFCRAVGHLLKFLFLLRMLCKLFDKALVGALACAALAMCLQIGRDIRTSRFHLFLLLLLCIAILMMGCPLCLQKPFSIHRLELCCR
jgi:hypothetical protein